MKPFQLLNPFFFLQWLTFYCCSEDAPSNDPRIGEAAMEQVALSKEALAWSKERDLANAERQKVMDELASQVARRQLETADYAATAGKEQYERYKTIAAPVEDAMFRDALTYDSNERQVEEAGRAGAEVQKNITAARAASARDAAAMGINPNAARFAAIRSAGDITSAAAEAAAENDARLRIRETGIGLRKDAAQVARSMPSAAVALLGTSTQAATGASAATIGAAENAARNNVNSMNAYKTAIEGVGSGAQTMQNNYDSQVRLAASKNANNTQMLASSIGAAATAYGSRDKED